MSAWAIIGALCAAALAAVGLRALGRRRAYVCVCGAPARRAQSARVRALLAGDVDGPGPLCDACGADGPWFPPGFDRGVK